MPIKSRLKPYGTLRSSKRLSVITPLPLVFNVMAFLNFPFILNADVLFSLHKKGKGDRIILAETCKNKTEIAKSGVGVVTARVRFVRASVSETDSYYAQPRTLSAVFRREPILLLCYNF